MKTASSAAGQKAQPLSSLHSAPGPILQRKCASCAEDDEGDGRAPLVQRKPASTDPSAAALPRGIRVSQPDDSLERQADAVADEVLRRPAGPHAPGSLADFGHRFAADFSGVRLHHDADAARRTALVGARAFTLGNDIYFGRGEHAPHTAEGRRLIAHELVHTQQQAPGQMALRTVSPRLAEIQTALAAPVTPADARRALEILQPLSDVDLADTVAALEPSGAIDRLMGGVSRPAAPTDSPEIFDLFTAPPGTSSGGQTDAAVFGDLLQRIQNVRVHTRTSTTTSATGTTTTTTMTAVGSCTPEQAVVQGRAATTALSWIQTAIAAMPTIEALPLGRQGQVFERHFHTLDPLHIGFVRQRFETMEATLTGSANTSFQWGCAPPTQPGCISGWRAFTNTRQTLLCPAFFTEPPNLQALILIHESGHGFVPRVQVPGTTRDISYGHSRPYQFLRPEEALDNADSYAMFAADISTGTTPITPVRDTFPGCTANDEAAAQRALAQAQRFVIQTGIILAQSDPATPGQYADLRRTHLGSDAPARLPALQRIFERMRTDLSESLQVECVPSTDPQCAGGAAGSSPFGALSSLIRLETIRVCSSLLAMSVDDAAERLLRILFSRRIAVSASEIPGLAAFARAMPQRFSSMFAAPPPLPQTLPQMPPGQAIA